MWDSSHIRTALLCGCCPTGVGLAFAGGCDPHDRGSTAMAQAAVGLLDSISEFCRRAGMAESTFGRRAVNDGKFVSRLRDGARITPETLERVSTFLTSQGVEAPASPRELMPLLRVAGLPRLDLKTAGEGAPSRNFRFFDNRQ